MNSQIERGGGLPMDVIHLIVTGAISVIFAGVFIGVPLVFSRVGRTRWPGMASTLVYFSCLGAGFIILELTFIQKFMKFIGYPLYTYSLVLFTLLLAAGDRESGVGPAAGHPTRAVAAAVRGDAGVWSGVSGDPRMAVRRGVRAAGGGANGDSRRRICSRWGFSWGWRFRSGFSVWNSTRAVRWRGRGG